MIIMTWLITIATAQAQSGLNVSPLFEGKIIPTQRMVETRVKGKMLSKYQLTFFRSVRFKANNKQESLENSWLVSLISIWAILTRLKTSHKMR